MKHRVRKHWKIRHSIIKKQLVLLFGITLFNTICSYFFFTVASNVATKAIYEKMQSQASYYLESIETQINAIQRQQANFFGDRKLSYLLSTDLLDSDYERREILLSIQDRLFSLMSANQLISSIELYIPHSNYLVTASRVQNIGAKDWERFQYLEDNIGYINYKEGELFYAIVESPYVTDTMPNFLLNVTFDLKLLERNLDNFSTPESGVFWYEENVGLFLEDRVGLQKGHLVLENLIEKEKLNKKGVEELKINKEKYLLNIVESNYLGYFVQYYPKDIVLKEMNTYTTSFIFFLILSIGMIFYFTSYTERMIHKPIKKLQQAFDVLEKGDTEVKIESSSNNEFSYLYHGFNHMTSELHRLIDEVYVQKNLAQKAELKQLQAQINPHFLFNSFFLLSRRVKRGDTENASILADYLGTYFQYITRNTSDSIELVEEMKHAQCYANIQATRFISRIKVEWNEIPKKYQGIIVPRLIVQPILENAFVYGLEQVEENGILRVSYQEVEQGIEIRIEDNAVITEEQIHQIRAKLKEDYVGEVTGIVNIHRRLRGFFKGSSGLEILRGELGGLSVSIIIQEEKHV